MINTELPTRFVKGGAEATEKTTAKATPQKRSRDAPDSAAEATPQKTTKLQPTKRTAKQLET